jgi:sodium transport system permease protein
MNWNTVRVLLLHELRMLLRDRRTVVLAIVLPLMTMPLILFATKYMGERRDRKLRDTTYSYAVTGTEQAKLRSIIAAAGAALRQAPWPASDKADDLRDFKCSEVQVSDPAESLRNKDIQFYLEALSGAEADARMSESAPRVRNQGLRPRGPSEVVRLKGVPVVIIHYRGDRDLSQAGRSKMRTLLERARGEQESSLLAAHGFAGDTADILRVKSEKLATPSQVAGSRIGRLLTVFLVMFLLSSGSIVAMDIIAGEKERGSLETLLTTAAGRAEIVTAKQLAILTVGLIATLIQLANMVFLAFRVVKLPDDYVYQATPAVVLTLLALFIPVAAFISSVLLMISAYAKTYKEAQLYFFPVYLVSLFPSVAAVLPGIKLRSAIVAVPLANVSVAVREIMVGKFDWLMIAAAFAVMSLAAIWTVRASARMLAQERLITSSESDAADLAGGPALFPRHVLRWYAVMGAVLLAVAANVPQLATFRRQLFFNEIILFVGGVLLMIRFYRLDVREALSLRGVNPLVWFGILLIIPSGNLVGLAVFRLADVIFPVPKHVLEQFGREIFPKDIPVWQLYLYIAVLPGICEEIAFRGTLLYGLRHRLKPIPLALAVGVIFGLFHVTLFRLIPTAFMGIFLTAIAIVTGSIFPCMVAHAGNNALAFWASQAKVDLSAQGWWVYGTAALSFAAGFWILWKTRPKPAGATVDEVTTGRDRGL